MNFIDPPWGQFLGFSPFQASLARRRASSYDRSGGNRDWSFVAGHSTAEIFRLSEMAGYICRIWFTIKSRDDRYLENLKFQFAFDDVVTADNIPFGALVATGPWAVNDIISPLVNVMRSRPMNETRDGVGLGSFNLHWPMPFCRSASIQIVNESPEPADIFYYVDHFAGESSTKDCFRFHITHNRRERTKAACVEGEFHDPDRDFPRRTWNEPKNCSRNGNHVFADIRSHEGFYAGTFLAVESHPDRPGKWYEGDDMFFIDGDTWPPTLHGTGTEDYFGMACGVHRKYQAFDHGVSHYERNLTDHDRMYDGRFGLYRWHLGDPISFRTSLHASIEAGHANDCGQFYESAAFWYGRPV